MLKRSSWSVSWQCIATQDHPAFASLETLTASPMTTVTSDSVSGVSMLSLSELYYVKRFSGKSEPLKQLLGMSRFHRETRNLKYFAAKGLSTPTVVAEGEQRTAGFLRSGVIVTAGIAHSVTLEELIQSDQFYLAGQTHARKLLKRLAKAMRTLHSDGFFARDIKTRNILVGSYDTDCTLYFFDCPSGHHPLAILRKRCIIRDLAYLERGLRGNLRRSDVLYLYKQYLGRDRLSTQDKTLATAVLKYYSNRRMTKKRRQRAAKRQTQATETGVSTNAESNKHLK
ncbi:MAG: lipopolysaccharide kinase InaA family protein [Halioglobus sp.]